MPLPTDDKAPWPPKDVAGYAQDSRRWSAWWSGDPNALADTTDTNRTRFWSRTRRRGPSSERRFAEGTNAVGSTGHLHAPLAGDIAATSADLLFGEEPELLMPGLQDARARSRTRAPDAEPLPEWERDLTPEETVAGQDRLEELADDIGLTNRLLEGAEVAAAAGGAYLVAAWNRDAADHPLLDVVTPDRAVPDFVHGVLKAVTLWSTLHEERSGGKDEVWRHLERHEPGRILHGLYVGDASTLGRQVALTLHPRTATLLPEVTDHARDNPRAMLVRYAPNVLPNRTRPGLPIGRADIAGSEPFLDALDETWTSLVRDIRLGKGRIIAARELLTPTGTRPGDPRVLDYDQELFTPLEMADLSNVPADKLFTPVQFAIRVQEHIDSAMALTEQIVSAAGYSPQTFGLHIEGRAESGTALRVREGKTWRTQGRKQRYWKPAVTGTVENLLSLDRVIFGRPTPVARPTVQYAELVDDPQGTATWLTLLRTAQAVSIETAVRLGQPDLDEDEVRAEAAKIMAEQGMGVPDPMPGLEVP